LINLLAQGTGSNERIGNQVKIRSIEMKMVISTGTALSVLDDSFNVLRMVLALWGGNTTTPLATAPATTMNKPIRSGLSGAGFIKKYLDKYIPITVTCPEASGGDGYTPGLRQIKYYKKFKIPLPITFATNATTYPDKRLILSMISDSSVTPHPGIINGYYVVCYEDA